MKSWTKEEEENLLIYKSKGYSIDSISSLLGRSYDSVQMKLRKCIGNLPKPEDHPGILYLKVKLDYTNT